MSYKAVKMTLPLEAEFRLYGIAKRQGRWYVASCPALDVTTQGRTLAEAKKNLHEAAELFIVSCLERGTLDQALRELGWKPTEKNGRRLPADAFPMVIPISFGLEKNAPCPA